MHGKWTRRGRPSRPFLTRPRTQPAAHTPTQTTRAPLAGQSLSDGLKEEEMDGRKAHGRLAGDPLPCFLLASQCRKGVHHQALVGQSMGPPSPCLHKSMLALCAGWAAIIDRGLPLNGLESNQQPPPSTDRPFFHPITQQVSSKEPVHAPCRPPPPPATTPPDSDNHSHQQQLPLALLSKHVHNQTRRLHVSA